MLRNIAIALLLAALLTLSATAQTATPEPPSIWKTLTDEQNISLVTYVLSNVADSGTDWNITAFGKQYNVSAVQRTSFVAGTVGGALALSHYVPKSKKWVTAGLVIGSAILAGRAYAHTLTRTAPGAIPNPAIGAKVAFAVRLR